MKNFKKSGEQNGKERGRICDRRVHAGALLEPMQNSSFFDSKMQVPAMPSGSVFSRGDFHVRHEKSSGVYDLNFVYKKYAGSGLMVECGVHLLVKSALTSGADCDKIYSSTP